MRRRCLLVAPLLLAAAIAAAGEARPGELTGIVTQVDGAVQLAGPGIGENPLASAWQVVRTGVAFHVPKCGAAGIVCSNRRFVRLRGPVSWSLSEPACAAGRELTPAEYALVAPQAGRFKVVAGILTLEREMRTVEDDDALAPIVLAPRQTKVLSPRPRVLWTPVPGATEYRVEWRGHGAGSDTRLPTQEISCGVSLDGTDVCSLPWPPDRPDLPPEQTFFLRISARQGVAEPWHSSALQEVRTLALAEALALKARLRRLENLGLEGPALDAARAGLLAAEGVYSDAAEGYRQALTATPVAALRVTLGDVALAMDLLQAAASSYREALRTGAPSARAAAAFGLGRVEYARGNFRAAAQRFQEAQGLYLELGLKEEEAAAHKAASGATARASR
jgi:hypothetical protein